MFRLSNCTALNYSSAQDGLTEAIWNEYSKGENWIVKAVLQVWADRCSHGAHTENLLRGYDFNIRDERCLIRKADVAELKSSKTYQRAKPIWGNVCRTRQSQFWLSFFSFSHCRLRRMCFRSSTCAHTETWKSQEWLCVCVFSLHGTASLLDTDPLAQGQEKRVDSQRQSGRKGCFSCSHSNTHANKLCVSPCQSSLTPVCCPYWLSAAVSR